MGRVMLKVTVKVDHPVTLVWSAVSDFYGFDKYFQHGAPVVSILGDGTNQRAMRRRIDFTDKSRFGAYVIQELQVCDPLEMVLITKTIASRLPGGSTWIETTRVLPEGFGSRIELTLGYRAKWWFFVVAPFFRHTVRKNTEKALKTMRVPVGAKSEALSTNTVASQTPYQVRGFDDSHLPQWVERVLASPKSN